MGNNLIDEIASPTGCMAAVCGYMDQWTSGSLLEAQVAVHVAYSVLNHLVAPS